ncbi:MAG: metallophosphoesterase family protein [Ferruginibacter sp.]|nr:metallophosphoesterase family protein [Ferruginibacter sp.]
MTKIGLISDTHGFLDEAIFTHFKDCDEIWHAGDFGIANFTPINITEKERSMSVWNENYFSNILGHKIIFRGVYGNIDDANCRNNFPEKLFFTCEEVNVFIQHIGGYPGRYSKGIKENIISNKCNLFISGHSHILKIMYDEKLDCLHINPGAAGKQGWHKKRTIVTLVITGSKMKDCKIIELD